MKKKIADLKLGDVIIINGKFFDVFEAPEKLENGEYLFTVVKHRMGDKVKKMPYVTPMDVSYETSSHFKNGEVRVATKEEIERMYPEIAETSEGKKDFGVMNNITITDLINTLSELPDNVREMEIRSICGGKVGVATDISVFQFELRGEDNKHTPYVLIPQNPNDIVRDSFGERRISSKSLNLTQSL